MAELKSELTGCEVEPDGSAVQLSGRDESGASFSLRLSIDQIGSLAMTLPGVIERALRVRYGDESLRYVYGLGSWTLETAADADVLILSLATVDGFNASYGLKRAELAELADALGDDQALAPRGPSAAGRRH